MINVKDDVDDLRKEIVVAIEMLNRIIVTNSNQQFELLNDIAEVAVTNKTELNEFYSLNAADPTAELDITGLGKIGKLIVIGDVSMRAHTTMQDVSIIGHTQLHSDLSVNGFVQMYNDLSVNGQTDLYDVSINGVMSIDAIDSDGALTLDAAGALSLDAGAASNFSTSAGILTLDGAGGVTMTTASDNNISVDPNGSGTLALGSASNTAVTMDALALTLTSVNALTLTDGTATLALNGSGATSLAAATSVDLDCAGAMSFNSSGASISIGDDDIDHDINIGIQGERTIRIGTGAFADTINVGNTTGATAVSITSGTGSIALASTGTGDITINSDDTLTLDADGVLELNSSAGAINIGNDANAQAMNIGTAGARTITMGNVTGATGLVLNSGTGGVALASTGTGDITINSDDTLLLDADGVLELNSSAGEINIGNDAVAQAMNIGTGAAARTITIGNDASTKVDVNALAIELDSAGSMVLDSVTTTAITAGSTMNITSTTGMTIDSGGVLTIDTDGTEAINLGIEAVAKTITIGNDASTKVDVNALAIELDSAGSIDITSTTGMTIDSGGVLTIDTDGTEAINLGIEAAAKTITIGNDASTKVDVNALAIDMDAGTGGIAIDTTGVLSIDSAGGASNISHTATANGDFTIEMDGGVDASLILSSAGTATDALQITASAGGVDINAAGALSLDAGAASNFTTSAGALTLNGAGGVYIRGGSNQVDITTNGTLDINAGTLTIDGTSLSIDGTTNSNLTIDGLAQDLDIAVTGGGTQELRLASAGTGEAAISLQASAGGVDIDAAASKDVNIAGGQVALVSKDSNAGAISLTTDIGTSETIVLTNTRGTAGNAIALTATAGGVDIDAAATKDVNIAGGQVALVSKDNAASAISLTADVGTNETIVLTNTQGTGAGAIALTSTAGGVDINAAGALTLDAGAASNFTTSAGALTLNGAGGVNVANDDVASTLNVGTGAANKTCLFGSNNSSSTTALRSGSGGVTVLANNGGITLTTATASPVVVQGNHLAHKAQVVTAQIALGDGATIPATRADNGVINADTTHAIIGSGANDLQVYLPAPSVVGIGHTLTIINHTGYTSEVIAAQHGATATTINGIVTTDTSNATRTGGDNKEVEIGIRSVFIASVIGTNEWSVFKVGTSAAPVAPNA